MLSPTLLADSVGGKPRSTCLNKGQFRLYTSYTHTAACFDASRNHWDVHLYQNGIHSFNYMPLSSVWIPGMEYFPSTASTTSLFARQSFTIIGLVRMSCYLQIDFQPVVHGKFADCPPAKTFWTWLNSHTSWLFPRLVQDRGLILLFWWTWGEKY